MVALKSAIEAPEAGALRISVMNPDSERLPLLFEPGEARTVAELRQWLDAHPEWVQGKLYEHGAFLFRGFNVRSEDDFETVARGINDELKDEYLGTSPREAQTHYVFSASELPGYYPIPQHCEMTFVANPPDLLFFCCLVEPREGGGETPLADFRAVARELDPAVKKRFEEGGIRIIRNYTGPGTKNRDLWQLKRWDEMFKTTDRGAINEKCAEQGFEAIWRDDDRLTLISTQPALKDHPVTDAEVWFNHVQVFHLSAAVGELSRIGRRRKDLRAWGLAQVSRAMVAWKKRRLPDELQAMHCTYADGGTIPEADMEHLRDVIWRNMVIIPWKLGDIVAIDNHSVSHGRLPYRGPRKVVVAWS